MNCFYFTLKHFIYIFNILFAIIGFVSLGIGIYGLSAGYANPMVFYTTYIVVGTLMVSFALLGCFAINRESVLLLGLFAGVIGFFFILQIVGLVRIYSHGLEKTIADLVERSWEDHTTNSAPMESYEKTFECCGLHGYQDYLKNNETIPDSCYPFGHHENDETLVYTAGCSQQMQYFASLKSRSIKVGSWFLVILEGLAIICSSVMSNYYRRMNRIDAYTIKL